MAFIILLPLLYFISPFFLSIAILTGAFYLKVKYLVIKGAVGEWYVNKELAKLGPMYKVYHDLYVPNEAGGTSQIDHVVTSPFGIFVMETKHYDGWILGKEKQKHWTQVIYKRKEKFLNPTWQNYGHIEALKKYLGDYSFHSLIVFSSRSTLKFEDDFNSARVIQIPQLTKVIKEWNTRLVSNEDLHKINKVLEKLTEKNQKQKRNIHKKHVEAIKTKQTKKVTTKTPEVTTLAPPCPKCGGQRSMKKGKYGSFYGCSQYPSCRYTEKVTSAVGG